MSADKPMITRVSEKLLVPVSDERKLLLLAEAGEIEEEITEVTETIEGLKDRLSERKATKEQLVEHMTSKVREAREGTIEPVDVEIRRDVAKNRYTRTRLDTGVVIEERALTADERQGELDFAVTPTLQSVPADPAGEPLAEARSKLADVIAMRPVGDPVVTDGAEAVAAPVADPPPAPTEPVVMGEGPLGEEVALLHDPELVNSTDRDCASMSCKKGAKKRFNLDDGRVVHLCTAHANKGQRDGKILARAGEVVLLNSRTAAATPAPETEPGAPAEGDGVVHLSDGARMKHTLCGQLLGDVLWQPGKRVHGRGSFAYTPGSPLPEIADLCPACAAAHRALPDDGTFTHLRGPGPHTWCGVLLSGAPWEAVEGRAPTPATSKDGTPICAACADKRFAALDSATGKVKKPRKAKAEKPTNGVHADTSEA